MDKKEEAAKKFEFFVTFFKFKLREGKLETSILLNSGLFSAVRGRVTFLKFAAPSDVIKKLKISNELKKKPIAAWRFKSGELKSV